MNSNKTYKLHMDSVSYTLKVPKSEIGCLIVRASHNVVEVTKRELVSKLEEGFSIIPGLCDMEGRKWYEGSLQKDFLSADFFGLDFDNGKYSKDEVIAKLEALGIPVFLVHDTYSSSDDCEKFHIIVCAKQTILEKDIRDKFQAVIMAPFVDGIDERCFNRNRYFNGTNKGIYYVNYEAEVDVFDAIERYWTGSDEQMQFIPRDSTLYKPTIATPKKKTAKVVVEKPQREKKVYELPGEEAYPDCTPTAGNGLYKYNMAKHYKEYMAFVEQSLETNEYVDGTGRKALIFDIFNEVSFAVSIRKAYKVCLEINDRFAEPLSVRDFNSCTWNAYRHIEEVCSDLHNTQFIYTYDRQLCRLGVDESSKAELTYYKNRENKEIADYLRPLKEERNSYIKNLREQGYGYKKIKKALVEKYGEIDAEFREKYEKPSELCLSISGIKKVLEKEGYTFGTIHSSNNIYIFPEPLADVQEEGLNAEQQEAYDLAIGGANIAILARGGCGKSYTLDWIANDMREAGRIVGRCAATGVAAQNIGGSTIHHMFGIIPDEEYSVSFNTVMNLLAYDCIQIDEIGMVDAETFSKVAYAINYIKRAYNHRIQLIVAGDPLQIVSVQGSYYFESPEYQTMGFTEVRLERNMRQANAEYDSLLASIRLGENRSYTVSALNHLCGLSENTEAMYAYAHKWRARQKNREKLSMLEGEAIQLDEKLTVKVGAKVVVTANGRADRHGIIRYYNGMQGVLKEVRRSSVVIETASGAAVVIKKQRIEVNEYESYEGYPLALGYAMTIHKLQGMTLDELNIHPSCFACGQLYTALSRVRTPEGVHLLRPVRPEYVKVNRAALDYVRSGRVREAV